MPSQILMRFAFLFLIGPGLAACASGFQADVTRFHALSAPSGEAITIRPAEGLEVGPEFTSYANLVGDRLAAEGYRPAASDSPDIVATLGYAIRQAGAVEDEGPQVGIGMGRVGRHTGVGLGTSFSLSGGPKEVYTYEVGLIMADAETGERLFEGRAVAQGTEATLNPVMPDLITALFTDFPGISGESRRVKIKPEQ